MNTHTRPQRSEAADYYFKYIDLVPVGDIRELLDAQRSEMAALLDGVAPERIDHRYAPDKWTIREVMGHLIDTERLFVFRAFWFARGFESPLPSFDQHTAVQSAAAGDRPWRGLVDEFLSLRASTVLFFRDLPPEAWMRRGIASDCPFSVRALAYLGVGHVIHHANILRERYL
jgi:uncharacterized protein (TIGR03083 family)